MTLEELQRRPTSEEINAMPLVGYHGNVRLIRDMRQLKAALPALRDAGVLGFDTESRPSFRKGKKNPPSLIQLATADEVYLIQLSWLRFGEGCAEILANPDVVKAGVGIHEDCRALGALHPFTPAGLVDLGEMAKQYNLNSHGLRTLAASLFGWRISKGSQCSNWSLRNLTPRQIAYAATDAWIGRLLYLRMLELGEDLKGLSA